MPNISVAQKRWVVLVPLLFFSLLAIVPSFMAGFASFALLGLPLSTIMGVLGLLGTYWFYQREV